MRNALVVCLVFFSFAASADLYVGDLATGVCKVEKGKDFKKAVKKAFADKSVEVTHSKEGNCGESAYLIRTKTRERTAMFPKKEGCECYLKMAKLLEPGK